MLHKVTYSFPYLKEANKEKGDNQT
jgi:hypothetical protein